MSNTEKFEGFDFRHNPYEQEARQRWGDQAVDRSNARLGSMSTEKQASMSKEMTAIYTKIAQVRDGSPESAEAQAAIKEWYHFLSHFGDYSAEAFKGLGQMYVDDERFTKNIDKVAGEGTAQFMAKAMAYFADQIKE